MATKNRANLHGEIGALTCPTPTSYAKDIKPLFTKLDVAHMKAALNLNLWDYNACVVYASAIYSVVQSGAMPPPGSGEKPWTPAMVLKMGCWIQQGCKP